MTTVPAADVDFSTFVLDLSQSPKVDCTSGTPGSRNCYAPESRLSAEFEDKMQKLITNFDLDDRDGDMGMPAMRFSEPEPVVSDDIDGTLTGERETAVESLDTTVDNEDDPLNLTGEEFEDSGDAGCSSDEQQQESRSLSLSYSLSISHAQENFSQYSQSTGLSKRYDSPCSYEDDRESECTNFDKLDDWSDLINDLHNNNNNNNNSVETANREFKDYLDDFLGKDQNGSSTSGVETSEEGTNDTKEPESSCEEEQVALAMQSTALMESGKIEGDSRPDTPALERKATVREKCRNFLEYRNPDADFEDDPMTDNNSNLVMMSSDLESTGMLRQQSSSGKRKLCEDYEDRERQLELIVEKFQKTDIVPDHGQHASLMDEERFAVWCKINSPNKTPVADSMVNTELRVYQHDDDNQTDDEKLVMLDGEEEDEDSPIATTPTNPRNVQRLFRTVANDDDGIHPSDLASTSDSQLFTKQRYLKKLAARSEGMQSTAVPGSSRKSLKLSLMEPQ